MSLNEICIGSGGILIILLTLIEITPIKLNPWSKICRWIGKQTQHDLTLKIDTIQEDLKTVKSDLKDLQYADALKEAQECRYRILRFADECYLGQLHSKEHFGQILSDISTYEKYCEDHPDFPNSVAILAIEQIKGRYNKHLKNHDFLS